MIIIVLPVPGECNCNDGHYGDSCSLTRSNAPTIIKNAFEDLCDSSQKPCRTFIIPGSDFINGTGLTCKYISMSVSFRLSMGFFYCKVKHVHSFKEPMM